MGMFDFFQDYNTRFNKYATDDEKSRYEEYMKTKAGNAIDKQNAIKSVLGTKTLDEADNILKQRKTDAKTKEKRAKAEKAKQVPAAAQNYAATNATALKNMGAVPVNKTADDVKKEAETALPPKTETTAETIKTAAKPEPKKVKEVVKEENKNDTDNDNNITDTDNTAGNGTDNSQITTEEAQTSLSENGIDPNTVDETTAKEHLTGIAKKLQDTGLFYMKDGKLVYKGIELEKDQKRAMQGTIGKILTAASVLAAIATDGAIPPMNLNKFFQSEDDEKLLDAKMQQMTDTVNQVVSTSLSTEQQKELKTMDQEFTEKMKDVDFQNAKDLADQQLGHSLAQKAVDFKNQKEMARLMADIQSSLPGDTKTKNIIAMASLKEAIPGGKYKDALKTMAEAVCAENGTTLAQMKAKTITDYENIVTGAFKPVSDILGAVFGN